MITDPVGDMLTRIRNGILVRHERVEIPLSRLKREIAKILKSEGFIQDFEVREEAPQMLTVILKYGRDRSSAILGLKRCSRPGRRVYVPYRSLPSVRGGLGITIISTSRGLLTNRDASQQQVGGELLCEVW